MGGQQTRLKSKDVEFSCKNRKQNQCGDNLALISSYKSDEILNKGVNIYEAMYDFDPDPTFSDADRQLSMRVGDRFFYHLHDEVGWAKVQSVSKGPTGWVPFSYLRLLPANSQLISNQLNNSTQQLSDTKPSNQISPWFHGDIDRNHAEYLLESCVDNSFLVRDSSKCSGRLCISLRHEGCNFHYKVYQDTDENGHSKYSIAPHNSFETIEDLILHHSNALDGLPCLLLYPAPKRTHATILAFADDTDEWEIDRMDIQIRKKLGSGQYGIVFHGYYKKHHISVAVKTLKKEIINVEEFLLEASVMKTLKHPHLVRLIGVCTREKPYYIITEYMSQGNLLEYLRHRHRDELTPPVLLYMGRQIASAMSYLENNKFLHRDLAARNCLVGEDHIVKVADFGLARCIQEESNTYTAHIGAKFPIKWTAPEGLAYNQFSSKSDVWAFGVLLWELVTFGQTPYPGVELSEVYYLLERGQRMNRPPGCPEPVYNLMRRCWEWKAADRPGFMEIESSLSTMFDNININSLVETLASQDINQDINLNTVDSHRTLSESSKLSGSHNSLNGGSLSSSRDSLLALSATQISNLRQLPPLPLAGSNLPELNTFTVPRNQSEFRLHEYEKDDVSNFSTWHSDNIVPKISAPVPPKRTTPFKFNDTVFPAPPPQPPPPSLISPSHLLLAPTPPSPPPQHLLAQLGVPPHPPPPPPSLSILNHQKVISNNNNNNCQDNSGDSGIDNVTSSPVFMHSITASNKYPAPAPPNSNNIHYNNSNSNNNGKTNKLTRSDSGSMNSSGGHQIASQITLHDELKTKFLQRRTFESRNEPKDEPKNENQKVGLKTNQISQSNSSCSSNSIDNSSLLASYSTSAVSMPSNLPNQSTKLSGKVTYSPKPTPRNKMTDNNIDSQSANSCNSDISKNKCDDSTAISNVSNTSQEHNNLSTATNKHMSWACPSFSGSVSWRKQPNNQLNQSKLEEEICVSNADKETVLCSLRDCIHDLNGLVKSNKTSLNSNSADKLHLCLTLCLSCCQAFTQSATAQASIRFREACSRFESELARLKLQCNQTSGIVNNLLSILGDLSSLFEKYRPS